MAKKKAQPRCRGYFLTVNEAALNEELNYDNIENYIGKRKLKVEYCCWDEERGDSGNLHIHLYIEFLDAKTPSAVCKIFPGAHVEQRKGDPNIMRRYVEKPKGATFGKKKEEKSHTVIRPIKELGDFTRLSGLASQGREDDGEKETLNEKLTRYVEVFNSVEEVEDVDLWFARQFRLVLAERFRKKQEQALFDKIGETKTSSTGKSVKMLKRKVAYLFGDSRAGKTFGVKMKYGSENVYTTTSVDHPFDDYQGQQVLHMDEFRSEMPFREFLTIVQGYREDNMLSARYQNTMNLAESVIVSTNIPIEQQYANIKAEHKESWQAFYNRFVSGVWELVYSPVDDMRFICCVSTVESYSPAARAELDFSDPPVALDGVEWVRDIADFKMVKDFIARGLPANMAAVQAEKDRFAAEARAKEERAVKAREIMQKKAEAQIARAMANSEKSKKDNEERPF